MSLDFILEADDQLNFEAIEKSLVQSGWVEIVKTESSIEAKAISYNFFAEKLSSPREIISEDTRGLSFLVGLKCYIRGKHVVSDEPFTRLIEYIAKESCSNFIVSFQYESALYWKNNNGLHKV